jgi:CubicO group peptidase (beta-lactamase class C family)
MKELVFKPAGMTSACFTGESTSTNNVAVGKSVRGPSRSALAPPYDETYNLNYQGMGGVVCSAQDLYNLIIALRSNKLLPMERTKEMLQPGQGSFGEGWFIQTLGETQSRVFHTGGVRGFLSSLSWYPIDSASLIVLSNNDEPGLFNKVETACRTILEAEFVKSPFSPEFLNSIAGVYVSGARRVNLSVDGSKINVLFDWGGPKTGGVLKKGKGESLIWATNTNETIEVFPGKTENGRIRSVKIMNTEYVRETLPSK